MLESTAETVSMEDSITIAIDRGGTFTDVWSSVDGKPDFVFKLLSQDPDHYKDAPTEGEFYLLPKQEMRGLSGY